MKIKKKQQGKCCCWQVFLQTQINIGSRPLRAGVWPSCLGKSIVLTLGLLSLCAALATVAKIYFTAAGF